MSRVTRTVYVLGLLVFAGIWFFSTRGDYPNPSEAFYVNDFAEVLAQATRSTIRDEGERLYNVSQDEVDGGAQLVFATFAVDNVEDVADYDKTEIYRQWKIGDNDMGALFLFFFVDGELVESQIEVGYRMEPYLTPTRLGQIIDSTIYDEEGWGYFFDFGLVEFLYEILTVVYVDAYDYDSFNYDMDVYYEHWMDYDGPYDSEADSISMSFWMFVLSPWATGWDRVGPIGLLALLFVGTGGRLLGARGGGGSSGGMGLFRRR